MRQSISTRYLGPTDYRGSRVKATSSSGLSVTLGWLSELDTDANHQRAALALAQKFGWRGNWIAGGGPDGRGNVYVNDDGDGFVIVGDSSIEAARRAVRELRAEAPESRGGIASTLDETGGR